MLILILVTTVRQKRQADKSMNHICSFYRGRETKKGQELTEFATRVEDW